MRSVFYFSFVVAVLVNGCGGGNAQENIIEDYIEEVSLFTKGETPFVYFLSVSGNNLGLITNLSYTIKPKEGYIAKPVNISYSFDYLKKNGYVYSENIIIPIIGLYENFDNNVDIRVHYVKLVNKHIVNIVTEKFISPDGHEYKPEIVQNISPNHVLDYNYFFVKKVSGGPMVYDIDGEIRWTSNAIGNSISSIFINGHYIVGDGESATVSILNFAGRTSSSPVLSDKFTNFHHNITIGKYGYLLELDATENGVRNLESVVVDASQDGIIFKEFDFSKIIAKQMRDHGDNPDDFVRLGKDWFHMNSAVYSKKDDSIIASSRENFVIKVSYITGDIMWIFGDPTKYWHTFKSLSDKAITIDDAEAYPVGQHALSVDAEGNLLLFDNGGNSFNQPTDASRGIQKTYSAARKYQIDQKTMKATSLATFDNGKKIFSDICSSVYETSSGSLLLNYSVADLGFLSGNITPRYIGVGKDGVIQFEFKTKSPGPCVTGWNADFINFEKLDFF